MINNFVQTFADMLSQGVVKTLAIILGVMSIFAMIDFVLTIIFESVVDIMQFLKVLFQKIVRYAIFFAIAKLYIPFTDNIVKAIFSVGYLFFPGGKRGGGKVGLPDFDEIFEFLMGSIKRIVSDWQLLKWHELSAHFTYLIMVIIGSICVLLIIKEIIVNFVELKIVIAVGVFLLPFNVFNQTKSIGAKLFNAIINSGGKLLVSVALTGVSLRVLQNNPFNSDGTANIGEGTAWIFLLGLITYLITNSRELGNMLVNGTGSSNSNLVGQVINTAVGTGVAALGGAALGGAAMKGGISKGVQAFKQGRSMKGIISATGKGMMAGYDKMKNSRTSKVFSKMGGGIRNMSSYLTGTRNFTNAPSDIWAGTGGFAGDMIRYDDSKYNEASEILSNKNIGKEEDYIYTGEKFKEAMKQTFEAMKSEYDEDSPIISRAVKGFKIFKNKLNSKEVKEEIFKKAKERMKKNIKTEENANMDSENAFENDDQKNV